MATGTKAERWIEAVTEHLLAIALVMIYKKYYIY